MAGVHFVHLLYHFVLTYSNWESVILRYHFVEHWRVGTIASQLGVHHYTVEGVLSEAGVERERQQLQRLQPMLEQNLRCLAHRAPPGIRHR